jgi:hypothetical protein
VNHEHYKLAGTQQALEDLGLTKEANILWNAGKGLFNAAAKPISWAFGRAGKSLLGMGQSAGLGQGTTNFLRTVGRGAAQDMGVGGLLMGGVGAATADPGKGWEGFQRGFAGGALGGLGYRVGSNLTQQGLLRGLGTRNYRAVAHATGPKTGPGSGWLGGFSREVAPGVTQGSTSQGFKQLGANALRTGVPIAGGVAASMYTPTFEQDPQAQQTQQYARMAYPLIS